MIPIHWDDRPPGTDNPPIIPGLTPSSRVSVRLSPNIPCVFASGPTFAVEICYHNDTNPILIITSLYLTLLWTTFARRSEGVGPMGAHMVPIWALCAGKSQTTRRSKTIPVQGGADHPFTGMKKPAAGMKSSRFWNHPSLGPCLHACSNNRRQELLEKALSQHHYYKGFPAPMQ